MLSIITHTKQHLFESTVNIFVSIINETTGAPILSQTPNIYIRRASDGFFFNGAAFVDTIGVPTALTMMLISDISAPGIYNYDFIDPGPVIPVAPALQLVKDLYQIRIENAGAPPTGGEIWDVREFARQLRDINTQGT